MFAKENKEGEEILQQLLNLPSVAAPDRFRLNSSFLAGFLEQGAPGSLVKSAVLPESLICLWIDLQLYFSPLNASQIARSVPQVYHALFLSPWQTPQWQPFSLFLSLKSDVCYIVHCLQSGWVFSVELLKYSYTAENHFLSSLPTSMAAGHPLCFQHLSKLFDVNRVYFSSSALRWLFPAFYKSECRQVAAFRATS